MISSLTELYYPIDEQIEKLDRVELCTIRP